MRNSLQRRSLAIAIASCFALGACGGDPADPDDGPGLAIVSGAAQSDTIDALLSKPLIVEVRDDDGDVVIGTVVRFESLTPWSGPALRRFDDNGYFDGFAAIETNSRGRAGVEVMLGTEAGEHRVVVEAPEFGFSDTVTFTTEPGAAASVAVSPADTARLPGESYTIHYLTMDRYGNVVGSRAPAGSVEFDVLSGPATVSAGGVVTAGSEYGRAEILVSTSEFDTSVFLSVVPAGTIHATRHSEPSAPDLVRFRTDGEAFTVLDDQASDWIELNATASPVDDAVVIQQSFPETHIVEFAAGAYHPLVSTGAAPQVWPQFTGDGSAVVFASGFGDASEIRSVPAAGGPSTLVLETPFVEVVSPSISPSGDRVAFVDRNAGQLSIVDLPADSINIGGVTMAKFSPVADRVAMVRDGDVWLVNGDGSDLHLVVAAADVGEGIPFTPRNLAWSPDGAWLVVNQAPDQGFPWIGPLVLVEVDTGLALPLGYRLNVSQATWGP